LQVAHAFVVDKNVIQIPEIDIGQLVGEDELQFGVVDFALGLVDFAASLVDQGVDFRIRIVATIGSVRGKLCRVNASQIIRNAGSSLPGPKIAGKSNS